KHPNNVNLNKELALFAMGKKDWSQAISHWAIIAQYNKKRMSSANYLDFAKALQLNGEEEKSVDVLSEAITKFPENKKMVTELAGMLSNQAEWNIAIDLWNKYFAMETRKKPITDAFTQLSKAYRKLKFYNEAEMILQRGIE